MTTINGVKAQNLQANPNENLKKPTMNEILNRMQANFEQCSNDTSAVQNQQDFSNNQNQNKSPFDNLMSMFQGENSILLSFLPMLLTKQKNANLGKEIMMKMLANSGNPMLSKIVGILTNIDKKSSVQETEPEITNIETTSKIDEFKKVE